MTGTAARRPGVQSVDRALDVLEVLSDGGAQGVTDIVRVTGLPLGTVHRLLATLVDRGYVRQDAERRYAVGPATLGLADAGERSIAAVGRVYAGRLTSLCGETANLAVLQGHEMVYIAQSPSPHSLRIFAEVGRRVPLHSTSVGKAVLAAMPVADAEALLRATRLARSTPKTLTTLDAIAAELDTVRRQGFAIDEEEQELGVRCVAGVVAVPGLHAALSVSGPTERFTLPKALVVADAVRETAEALAGALRS
ncbi:IclR family transcriptional regulator [Luteipulveratus halotolerans]|uniref:Glycerol operon regulatory protein n=1 Tax=Luteipulveratus halotolerans TaxID=1631356 RepID=A0A0L6CI70_9MICO|nr:IclR family transcriptional regulator [Luteipulveratus halotolerans]KNX37476.1 hypothetical protein VV01_10480 [Luteipulveratus halotolerans]